MINLTSCKFFMISIILHIIRVIQETYRVIKLIDKRVDLVENY